MSEGWWRNLKCISILHEAPITRKLHFFLFFYVLKLMRHFYQVGWKTFAGMTGASVIKYAHPGPSPILRWGCLKNVEHVFTFLPIFQNCFKVLWWHTVQLDVSRFGVFNLSATNKMKGWRVSVRCGGGMRLKELLKVHNLYLLIFSLYFKSKFLSWLVERSTVWWCVAMLGNGGSWAHSYVSLKQLLYNQGGQGI